MDFEFFCVYVLFLRFSKVAMAIAMIIAITPTTMYVIRSDVVAKPVTGSAVDTGVDACITVK